MNEFVNWPEQHPTLFTGMVALLIAMVSGVYLLINAWLKYTVRLKVKLSMCGVSGKRGPDGELVVQSMKLRVKISKRNQVPVTVDEFYLELPKSIIPISDLHRLPFTLDKTGRRIYQNYLPLSLEDGEKKPVPFDLGPVQNLIGVLDSVMVNEQLYYKLVRFVLVDQNGNSHKSNYLRLDPWSIGSIGQDGRDHG